MVLLASCTGPAAPTPIPPAPPSDLRLEAAQGAIVLRWRDESSDELGFAIYREEVTSADTVVGRPSPLTSVTADVTEYRDEAVEAQTFYRYGVAAQGDGVDSTLILSQGRAVAPLTLPVGPVALRIEIGGRGAVSSAGLLCDSSCQTVVPAGNEVALRSHPATGWRLAGWSGSCQGSAPTCSLTPAADGVVRADFTPDAAAALGPVSHSCNAAPVGASCTADLVLVNAGPFRGLEFELATGFAATGVTGVPVGCLARAGAVRVAIACEASVDPQNELTVATLSLRRTTPGPSLLTTDDAFLAVDAGSTTALARGSLVVR